MEKINNIDLTENRLHDRLPKQATLISVQAASELDTLMVVEPEWIDLKDPQKGSLGCPAQSTTEEFLRRIEQLAASLPNKRRPRLSIALGDIDSAGKLPLPTKLLSKFSMVKFGIAKMLPSRGWIATFERWSRATESIGTRWVPTWYADKFGADKVAWSEFLSWGVENNIDEILIDTANKNGQSTFDFIDPQTLANMILDARLDSTEVLVAGSLTLPMLPLAYDCGASIVGIRSAICQKNTRTNAIDPLKLQELAALWQT